MPFSETLSRFISRVEEGAHVEAIEEYYAPDASMQENGKAPRMGRATLVESERKALAGMRSIQSRCIQPVFVNGDHVVIRWVFDIEAVSGKVLRLEELAYQRWQGERIVEETFFYDPAQLQSSP